MRLHRGINATSCFLSDGDRCFVGKTLFLLVRHVAPCWRGQKWDFKAGHSQRLLKQSTDIFLKFECYQIETSLSPCLPAATEQFVYAQTPHFICCQCPAGSPARSNANLPEMEKEKARGAFASEGASLRHYEEGCCTEHTKIAAYLASCSWCKSGTTPSSE